MFQSSNPHVNFRENLCKYDGSNVVQLGSMATPTTTPVPHLLPHPQHAQDDGDLQLLP